MQGVRRYIISWSSGCCALTTRASLETDGLLAEGGSPQHSWKIPIPRAHDAPPESHHRHTAGYQDRSSFKCQLRASDQLRNKTNILFITMLILLRKDGNFGGTITTFIPHHLRWIPKINLKIGGRGSNKRNDNRAFWSVRHQRMINYGEFLMLLVHISAKHALQAECTDQGGNPHHHLGKKLCCVKMQKYFQRVYHLNFVCRTGRLWEPF